MTLEESLEQASREVAESPDWVKAIYEQNEHLEKVLELRKSGKPISPEVLRTALV